MSNAAIYAFVLTVTRLGMALARFVGLILGARMFIQAF